jgi:hypothetical protein
MTTMPMEPEYPPQEPERRGDHEPDAMPPPATPASPPPMTIPVEPEYPPEEDARASSTSAR